MVVNSDMVIVSWFTGGTTKSRRFKGRLLFFFEIIGFACFNLSAGKFKISLKRTNNGMRNYE